MEKKTGKVADSIDKVFGKKVAVKCIISEEVEKGSKQEYSDDREEEEEFVDNEPKDNPEQYRGDFPEERKSVRGISGKVFSPDEIEKGDPVVKKVVDIFDGTIVDNRPEEKK